VGFHSVGDVLGEAESYLQAGMIADKLERYGEAIDFYVKVNHRVKQAEALQKAGHSAIQLKDFEQALPYFWQAAGLAVTRERSANAFFWAAKMADRSSKIDLAADLFEQAGELCIEAKLYARSAEMYVLSGDARLRIGSMTDALYAYNRAYAGAEVAEDRALISGVLEKKARVEYVLRLLQEAAASFAEAATLQLGLLNFDRASDSYLQAARCLFELTDYGVAASYAYAAGGFRAGISQHKKAGDAFALGGDMALLAGDCKKARSYWKEAKNAYRIIEYRYTQPKCDAAAARERIESSLPQIP
jgi:tetratricopeptide (TPR) repeat protein